MEEKKENKFRLNGICPECGKLFDVEFTIATGLPATGPPEQVKEGEDAKKGETKGTGSGSDEGGDLRPDSEQESPAKASGADEPADSAKGKRAKKTGGG